MPENETRLARPKIKRKWQQNKAKSFRYFGVCVEQGSDLWDILWAMDNNC